MSPLIVSRRPLRRAHIGASLSCAQESRCSRFIALDFVAQPRDKSFHAFAPNRVSGDHEIKAADMRHSVASKRSAQGFLAQMTGEMRPFADRDAASLPRGFDDLVVM